VTTYDPARRIVLEVGDDGARLSRAAGGTTAGSPAVRLPAEAFVRLVHGRLDPDRIPPGSDGDVDLDLLRRAFPGF
jgi:hypothetical protein